MMFVLRTVLCLLLVYHYNLLIIANVLENVRCTNKDTQCNWQFKRTWTQGGYHALCHKKDLSRIYHRKIFIERNIYQCTVPRQNLTTNKILNLYSDDDGKLCHLIKGEKRCPGYTRFSTKSGSFVLLNLNCGELKCRIQYHRCDVCLLTPWYKLIPESVGKRKVIGCKTQIRIKSARKIGTGNACYKCNGEIVNKKFCINNSNSSLYYVDIASSKPNWGKWTKASECKINTRDPCQNGNQTGTMSYEKHCRYTGSIAKLNPKYCGRDQNKVFVPCQVPCHPNKTRIVTRLKSFHKFKLAAAYTWVIALAVILAVVFVFSFIIYMKYTRSRARNGESCCKMFPEIKFQSSATQTSSLYNPSRIILEPEYALVGDYRSNFRSEDEYDNNVYSLADDNVQPGHILSDNSVDDSDDECKILLTNKPIEEVEIQENLGQTSAYVVDAQDRRAIYARINKQNKARQNY